MLAEALQAEVDADCARFADECDENGRRLVVRNGYHEPREVTPAPARWRCTRRGSMLVCTGPNGSGSSRNGTWPTAKYT